MRKFITHSEWLLFFHAIDGAKNEIRDKTMLQMAYIHGLRVSELISLKVSDVNIAEPCIYIRRLKNGLSTVHPLQRETVSLLTKWLALRTNIIRRPSEDFLFLSNLGHELSRQYVYKMCRKYSCNMSINIHPHMLRHGCGYALANQGLDTRLIQDYLGHKNIHHTVLYTASNAARFKRVWDHNIIN
ncbi:integrase [Salmonella enterica subsp. diarizonae]|nr:integrase [Salmonella enterica subsp. diarizonae]EBK6837798.1 integrase [Salmonella enterica]EDR3234992.1 tyrosine-type recombinase/integrase [Salmonella enterica subsp. diarizonae]